MSRPADVVSGLADRGLTIATAESLTAGLLAATIADVPGASAILQGGVIAYQNHVKERVLGVDAALLARHGAVHPEVAQQMARGARRVLGADLGVSTTGVAGPEPHQGKPVGTVYVGISGPDGDDRVEQLELGGGRAVIRSGTVEAVLAELLELLTDRRR